MQDAAPSIPAPDTHPINENWRAAQEIADESKRLRDATAGTVDIAAVGVHDRPFVSPSQQADGAPGASTPLPLPEGFLRSLFGDGLGNVSAMRVAFVLVTLIVVLAWAIISVRAGALQPLPPGFTPILLILTGGKLLQNGQENDANLFDTKP